MTKCERLQWGESSLSWGALDFPSDNLLCWTERPGSAKSRRSTDELKMSQEKNFSSKFQEYSGLENRHHPKPHQLVVISEGVYEGDVVEGVRYPSPEHMSGWWLTTDRYDGDIKSLKTVHFHHVAECRPDLFVFLGLPFGYRFFSGDGHTWLDQAVAASQP